MKNIRYSRGSLKIAQSTLQAYKLQGRLIIPKSLNTQVKKRKKEEIYALQVQENWKNLIDSDIRDNETIQPELTFNITQRSIYLQENKENNSPELFLNTSTLEKELSTNEDINSTKLITSEDIKINSQARDSVQKDRNKSGSPKRA